jgi:hypothetical protein
MKKSCYCIISYSLNIINWSFQIRFASIHSIPTSENEVPIKQITQNHCHSMSPNKPKHRKSNVNSLSIGETFSFSRKNLLQCVCYVCQYYNYYNDLFLRFFLLILKYFTCGQYKTVFTKTQLTGILSATSP